MLRAILNKSWMQPPTKHQLYSHLPPITKTIQVSRTKHAGHCWRSRDELMSDVLLWTPAYGQAKAGRPARTYIQHLCWWHDIMMMMIYIYIYIYIYSLFVLSTRAKDLVHIYVCILSLGCVNLTLALEIYGVN